MSDHRHAREPAQAGGHGHVHGIVDPSIVSTTRGLWVLQWSFAGLMVTALIQIVVVMISGSVALLADTIHNFADAATAIPLAVAFWLARRPPSRRFPYGLGRVEDFAGLTIVLVILMSAGVAAYEAIHRLLHPQPITQLGAVMAASIVGFLGNEGVAIFRIRVGRQIGSAALVADGYHARVDGWTSLAVLAGALGVWAGYPAADPVMALAISVAILWIVFQAGRSVVVRMLDGVDVDVLDEIEDAARHAPSVESVSEVRARWIGHRLHAEVNVTVPGGASVDQGHDIAGHVRHHLFHHLPHLGGVIVHVDPSGREGEHHHRIDEHAHDDLPPHAHG